MSVNSRSQKTSRNISITYACGLTVTAQTTPETYTQVIYLQFKLVKLSLDRPTGLMHRWPLPLREDPWYSFLLEAKWTTVPWCSRKD
jgi:hypothetical protein